MPQPNTAKGFRRPAATDRLTDAWDHISDLADDVDAYLGGNWVTTGFVMESGWTNAGCRYRRFGPLVIVEIVATRSGVALGSPATGDMSNNSVLTLPVAARPATLQAVHWNADSATDGGMGIGTDGSVSLYSMNSTASVASGATVRATAVFALNVL